MAETHLHIGLNCGLARLGGRVQARFNSLRIGHFNGALRALEECHSINSSVRSLSVNGIDSPSDFAVFRLITRK